LSRHEDIASVFRNPERPVVVRATIELDRLERDYLNENAERLIEELAWGEATGKITGLPMPGSAGLATEKRIYGPQIEAIVNEGAKELREALAASQFELSLTLRPNLT